MNKKVTLHLPIKPYSINKALYKNRKYTDEARKWRAEFFSHLEDYSSCLTELGSLFNPKKHAFKVFYTFLVPSNILFTKKGTISARCPDLTNIEKMPQDLVFNAKYDETWLDSLGYREKPLYGSLDMIYNIGVDDRFIVEMGSRKAVGPSYMTIVEIELISNGL